MISTVHVCMTRITRTIKLIVVLGCLLVVVGCWAENEETNARPASENNDEQASSEADVNENNGTRNEEVAGYSLEDACQSASGPYQIVANEQSAFDFDSFDADAFALRLNGPHSYATFDDITFDEHDAWTVEVSFLEIKNETNFNFIFGERGTHGNSIVLRNGYIKYRTADQTYLRASKYDPFNKNKFIMTYDSGTLTFYLNGEKQSSVQHATPAVFNALGSGYDGEKHEGDTLFFDLRIWDTARTADEIAVHDRPPIENNEHSLLVNLPLQAMTAEIEAMKAQDSENAYIHTVVDIVNGEWLPNEHIPSLRADDPHLSLPVQEAVDLSVTPDHPVKWESDHPLIDINGDGTVRARSDARITDEPSGQATITATSLCHSDEASIDVTIVPWQANQSYLEITNYLPNYVLLGLVDAHIYYAEDHLLYRTSDGFSSNEFVTELPFVPSAAGPMLETPFGYFMRGDTCVYQTDDLLEWTCVFETLYPPHLTHHMDYTVDEENDVGYVFVKEYQSWDHDNRVHLYRGTVDLTSTDMTWETVLTMYSNTEQTNDPSLSLQAVRHFHVVQVDPYTGHVWVGTGDLDQDSMIMVSDDFGETFHHVGFGSQEWRTLAFWFTEDYVYWNMDTGEPPQRVFRIPRTVYDTDGEWPAMTPLLAEGTTSEGVRYFVLASKDADYFPAEIGAFYTETEARTLDADHQVIAITDDTYDYREVVADLTDGAHRSVYTVQTEEGEDVVLMAATSEGVSRGGRDLRGRVFGFQERADGSVNVQEVYSTPSIDPHNEDVEKARIEGVVQDTDGTIYFKSYETPHRGIYAGRLQWYTDNG